MRGKLAGYANELLFLGTDGFRVDAAKREEQWFCFLLLVASLSEARL